MSSRERFGRNYIETELREIAAHLQTDVDAYLIGGGAMSLHKPSLKDTTKDIDLVVVDEAALRRLMGVLDGLGYEEVTDLGDEYDRLGARHCVRNDAGCQFDIFYRQIADKLYFSDGMQARSEAFLSDDPFSVGLVSFEDIFLFKAVAERPDDIGDMATLVQTDLSFDVIEDDLFEGATVITPLSHDRFRVTDVQEQRVVIEFLDRDIDETRSLQREQFETFYHRITEESGDFDLERLPPDADPYPAVLSLHPRFKIDEDRGQIIEREGAMTSRLLDTDGESTSDEDARTEPELDVYADALLLVDALERHEVDVLEEIETDALVNLYTLLSDVQRNANALRQDVADVLLNGSIMIDR